MPGPAGTAHHRRPSAISRLKRWSGGSISASPSTQPNRARSTPDGRSPATRQSIPTCSRLRSVRDGRAVSHLRALRPAPPRRGPPSSRAIRSAVKRIVDAAPGLAVAPMRSAPPCRDRSSTTRAAIRPRVGTSARGCRLAVLDDLRGSAAIHRNARYAKAHRLEAPPARAAHRRHGMHQHIHRAHHARRCPREAGEDERARSGRGSRTDLAQFGRRTQGARRR
jgi:hypothetical protein